MHYWIIVTTGKREKDFILLNNNNDADNNMQASVTELQERMNTILYFISWATEVLWELNKYYYCL